MRIARPWSLELAYTREMMAGLLLRPQTQWPRHALLIGLGAGSLAKFIYRNLPDCHITVVEINPQVEYIARQYFKLPDDPKRLDVIIGCGADYMLAGGRKFDLILADGYDPDAKAGVLDTEPFYLACRSRLSERGLLVPTCSAAIRVFRSALNGSKRLLTSERSFFLPATAAIPSPTRRMVRRLIFRWMTCAPRRHGSKNSADSTCCR